MAGKRAHMPHGYGRWTRKRWFERLCEEVGIKRRRSRHVWQIWPPGILRTSAQLAYCSIKGRELGDRAPALELAGGWHRSVPAPSTVAGSPLSRRVCRVPGRYDRQRGWKPGTG